LSAGGHWEEPALLMLLTLVLLFFMAWLRTATVGREGVMSSTRMPHG
jgi:hypothetical protein